MATSYSVAFPKTFSQFLGRRFGYRVLVRPIEPLNVFNLVGLILAGNAKFISAFIDISFVFYPLIVDVRCLLDALIISVWCSHHLLIFFLGYGWDGCQENNCDQRRLHC